MATTKAGKRRVGKDHLPVEATPGGEGKSTEDRLNDTLAQLNERVKEQTCLYQIARLNELKLEVSDLLEQAVSHLPAGFKHEDLAEAAIKFRGRLYSTSGYHHQKFALRVTSRRKKREPVEVRVVYRRKKGQELQFLQEEQRLLEAVADLLAMKLAQRSAQELVRESEEKYRRLFDGSPLPKLVVEEDSLRIMDVNQTALHSYGFRYAEFTDRKQGKAFEKSGIPQMLKQLKGKRAEAEAFPMGRFTQRKKNGERIEIEAFAHRIQWRGRSCIVIACEDITSQVETWNLLRKSEERLQQAVKVAKLGYWRYNLKNSRLVWSDEVYEIWGRDADAFAVDFAAFLESIHPADRKAFMEAQAPALEGKEELDLEHRILLPDGSVKWVHEMGRLYRDEEGEPAVFAGTVQDITERKRLENLLDEALELARIGSWELDLRDNKERKLYWSEQVREIHGVGPDYEPDLATGLDFYAPSSRGVIEKAVKAAISDGKPFDIELKLITASDETRWVRAIGRAECGPDGKCTRVYGSFQDIHDRKAAELEQVRILQERNSILESIGEAFFAVDRNWIVNYWNKVAEQVLGRVREAVLGQNLWEQFPEALGTKFSSNYELAFATGKPVHFEEFHTGSEKWFEVNAYPGADKLSVFFRDITERKRDERLLRESNERFEMAASATNDAIWDWNIVDNITFRGSGFKTLFGFDPDIAQPGLEVWWNWIHSDDYPRIQKELESALGDPDRDRTQYEYRLRRSDGSYAHVVDRGVIIRDDEGKPLRMVGAISDISYRKEHEKALRRLNDDLAQRARELAASNAELEQFAYVASHDLQEPLRMVSSFLTQLDRKYGDRLDDKAHRYINFAVDGARRMRNIILDLLEYSRIGKHSDKLADIDMEEVVNEVLALNRRIIEKTRARVTMGKLPTLKSYRSPLIQIFQNLLSNALKYHKDAVAPEIHISCRKKGRTYTFCVEDNGIGIAPEYQEKIFTIFQRLHTSEKYPGTGMGLGIVKKIVDNLGGTIRVESEEGIGSRFYFTIPEIS